MSPPKLMVLPHEKPIYECQEAIEQLKAQDKGRGVLNEEIAKLEEKLSHLKEQIYAELSAWDRVRICRHDARPRTVDYIAALCTTFQELGGDRAFGNDSAVVGGLGRIGEMECVILGQEKGCDTESRVQRNFGMCSPEGFRKARRLMHLAEKFSLPVVALVDTPGALATLEAEERGQAWAIAENLQMMARLRTPIIVVVIGEGCSGGALGIAVGDVVGMLEHSYYSVISPEGCASILYKDTSRKGEAAEAMKMHAEHLLELQVIDEVIPEPLGGAHHDPQQVFAQVKNFLLEQWRRLRDVEAEVFLENRYTRFRRIGKTFTQ